MDLASAGSFVSGGQKAATGLAGPGIGAATSAPPPNGNVRGLVPPPSSSPPAATGLQGPGDTSGATGPGGDRGDGSLSYMQRVAKALGTDPYHIRYTDGPGGAGLQSARLIPVAGGFGGGAPTADGTPEFEFSKNPRAAEAFDALSNIDPNLDVTGTLAAYRDSSDIGAYLNELEAKNKVDDMKTTFRKNLMNPPTEEQLGVLPGYVNNENGEAVPVYDQKELLEHYRSAYRMAVLERQGSIELDHSNWKIKSIGNTKLTPEQFVEEIRNRYQSAFADGVDIADKRLASGERPIGEEVPLELQRGILADRSAQKQLRDYLNSINVPEGPGQLIALNRWAYYQDGSGLHGQPDVLIDAGIAHRHILDGKATDFEDLTPPMRKQLERYYDFGADSVGGVTQRGHASISSKKPQGRRR